MVIKKFLRNLNDYGFSIAMKKGMAFLVKPFYENKTYRVYVKQIDGLKKNSVNSNSFRFMLISPDNTEIIRQIEEMEEWLGGQVLNLLKTRYICMVAMDDGKLAGFNLVAFQEGELPLIEYRKKLRKHEAWSEQISVHPDYRGKGLGTSLREHVFDELYNRGITKFYGGAQRNNIASLKVAQKSGFRNIADIQYVKVLHRKQHNFKRIKDGKN